MSGPYLSLPPTQDELPYDDQDQLKIDQYYWYDPYNPEDLAGFMRVDGIFQPLEPDAEGRLLSPRLGLLLVRWHGVFQEAEATWLRWATSDGVVLPTEGEQLKQAHARAAAAEAELARLRKLLDDKHAGNS